METASRSFREARDPSSSCRSDRWLEKRADDLVEDRRED